MECSTYNLAVLEIFLKAVGEGFPEAVLCFEGNNKGDRQLTSNNFKQKVKKMRAGNMKQAVSVRNIVSTGLFRFVDGGLDNSEKFCRKEGSDKYTKFFRGLWQSLDFRPENFFYEDDRAVLAYLIARWLVKSCEKEHDDSCVVESLVASENIRLLASEEKETYIQQVQEVFRPEYYSALWDVVKNGGKNRTFYKWPIEELYKGCDKEKVDKIIECVFLGKDMSISSTFERLQYKSGARQWTTFDKLFQNELKDEKLKASLQDGNLMEKYQVFQSRMILAFVLENLREILPREIGEKELVEKIFESLFRHVKGEPIDLKAEFLVPDHDRKTTEYEEAVWNLINETDREKLETQLENLDKDCPATPFFKKFIRIVNSHAHFYFGLSADDVESMKHEARENIRYLGSFSGYKFTQRENLHEEFF